MGICIISGTSYPWFSLISALISPNSEVFDLISIAVSPSSQTLPCQTYMLSIGIICTQAASRFSTSSLPIARAESLSPAVVTVMEYSLSTRGNSFTAYPPAVWIVPRNSVGRLAPLIAHSRAGGGVVLRYRNSLIKTF